MEKKELIRTFINKILGEISIQNQENIISLENIESTNNFESKIENLVKEIENFHKEKPDKIKFIYIEGLEDIIANFKTTRKSKIIKNLKHILGYGRRAGIIMIGTINTDNWKKFNLVLGVSFPCKMFISQNEDNEISIMLDAAQGLRGIYLNYKIV
jgi:stage III sporulation protein SpoIIIAA